MTIGQVLTPSCVAERMREVLERLLRETRLSVGHLYEPCCGDRRLSLSLVGRADRYSALDVDDQISAPPFRGDVFDFSDRVDTVICNPPWVGGGRIGRALGPANLREIKSRYPARAAGAADLASYVLRHVLETNRPRVSVWVATNTIAQGSSRRVGLQWALANGFEIKHATANFAWPTNEAAVVCRIFALVSSECPPVLATYDSDPY